MRIACSSVTTDLDESSTKKKNLGYILDLRDTYVFALASASGQARTYLVANIGY